MPHLSPMNWLLSFIMFWMFITISATYLWWVQPMKFSINKYNPISLSSHKLWKW